MFLTESFDTINPITYSQLIKDECFSETFKKDNSDPSYDLSINMIENKLDELYKWWPATEDNPSPTYSKDE
jgi:hypothetical protein